MTRAPALNRILHLTKSSPADGEAELFEAAFRGSINPMLLLTLERKIVASNPALAQAVGYREDALADREAGFLIDPEQRPQSRRDWEALRKGRNIAAERVWIRADGSRWHVEFAAYRRKLADRELVLIVVLDRDGVARWRPKGREGACDGTLSPRELEVVSYIAIGWRLPEIAQELFISPATARTHARNAMEKLGARSQAQLVAIALVEGMLDPDCVRRTSSR